MDFTGDSIDALVDELSGDDDDIDFSGAEGRRGGARPQSGNKTETYNVKDLPIGFAGLTTTASLGAGLTFTSDVPIKTAFRPDRLVLNTVALDLDVADIVIGTIRLNVGSQPVPGVCFARDAIGTRLKCAVVATPSVFPQVVLVNPTAAAILLPKGGFFGPMKRV